MSTSPPPDDGFPSSGPMDGGVLQQRLGLSGLVDSQSFTDVITAFVDLYRVGVKVFDAAGHKLVDIRVGNTAFCGYLWEHGATRQACTRLVMALKGDAFPTKDGVEVARVVDCFSGLRYMVLPLIYEGDTVGRLIFGPYMPQTLGEPSEQLYRIEPRLDRTRANELVAQVRRAPDDLVATLLAQVQRIVDVILFTSYKAYLASQMHIESVTASYADLQQKNRMLEETNARLKELDTMKSNFLATISHELRTPLTSVIGYSEMLLEGLPGALNDEQREYVETIMSKGVSLLELITQILDLSRIESGNLQLHVTEFGLREVIKGATTSVVPQCQKKGITLNVTVEDNLPLLKGDRDKLGQVLVNLLGNAVKFTAPKGSITVNARRTVRSRQGAAHEDPSRALFALSDEEYVCIDVADTGIGIPQDKLSQIFDRFFQVNNSSTREYGGTGLGLSIVKSFVEAHGGEITVKSTVGQGSTFTVLLPL